MAALADGVAGRAARPVPVELLAHLRRARDHIDRHYRTPLDLDQLASVAGVSKFHFVRSFEATYGETPMRYLTRRRIERAQDLLRGANLTVTEVCMLVGFASLGSFSSRFTQLVGETPTAYRNRWAGSTARVPGCYLFMRGGLDPAGTTGVVRSAGAIRSAGVVRSDSPAEAVPSRNLEEAPAAGDGLGFSHDH